ncbi:hypothetical protein Dimus_020320 [Dionaea muscipula]
MVYRHETEGRMAKWMGRDLNWNLTQSFNISGQLINVTQEALVDRNVAWKKKASSKCEELERKIERLEKKIAKLEQQHPAFMDEMIDLWQVSEEGKVDIAELCRPSTKTEYNMAYQRFAFYLSEVPADKKCHGLPWPHDDISVTDQNVLYYITDRPPSLIVVDVGAEEEEGEVNIVDP